MAIFMGVMLIVLGVVVLAAPVAAGMASVMIIGALMAAAGVVEILRAFRTQAAWFCMKILLTTPRFQGIF